MQADLYIAALGRSGSTMLTNMLTRVPDHLMFNEPRFHAPPYRGVLQAQLDRFKITLGNVADIDPKTMAPDIYLKRLLGPHLAQSRWGMKEVLCSEHAANMSLFSPKYVILSVRHIFDVAVSFFEKHRRQGNDHIFTPDWVEAYCQRETSGLILLHKNLCANNHPVLVVRYEDLTQDAQACLSPLVKDWAWPITGHATTGFASLNRGFEVDRHGAKPNVPVSLEMRELPDDLLERASLIQNLCHGYLQYFGYTLKSGLNLGRKHKGF